tara:strand:+ start:433 stop:1857 length:1425 start_codon:yes stop_codon:yes gene_type:complete
MADKNLNIKVRAKGAKKAKKELKGVEKGMASLGKAAAIASAAFFGAKMLISGLKNAIELSGKQELAEKKLATALGKTSKALLDQASALQQVSMFGDEDIIMMQSMLASFVKGEDEIKLLTKATLDLAAGMGLDLKGAGDLVAKTIGSSTNAMSRYGIEVTGAVGSTERLETLTNNVANLFGGQALAQSKTMTGSIEQMKNATGDTAEALGDLLAPTVIKAANALKGAAEWASKFLLGLKNLKEFGNVVGELEKDTKPLLEAQIAANKVILNDLVSMEVKRGRLNEHQQGQLVLARTLLETDQNKLAILTMIEEANQRAAEQAEHAKIVFSDLANAQKQIAQQAAYEAEARNKASHWAATTASSMVTSAVMGDSIGKSLQRAVIQMLVMVAQAKLYDFFMTSATGGLNKVTAGITSFLFGASPTQSAPNASAASNQKITINQNFGGMGVIDHNFAANSIIPAINKAISTGQSRIN